MLTRLFRLNYSLYFQAASVHPLVQHPKNRAFVASSLFSFSVAALSLQAKSIANRGFFLRQSPRRHAAKHPSAAASPHGRPRCRQRSRCRRCLWPSSGKMPPRPPLYLFFSYLISINTLFICCSLFIRTPPLPFRAHPGFFLPIPASSSSTPRSASSTLLS